MEDNVPYRGKPVVLVAEDDPDDRLLLEEALRPFRNHLLLSFVEDRERLMEYLRQENRRRDSSDLLPQLILLNFNGPGKDGFLAVREIKEDVRLRDIPVVIWTSFSIEEEKRRCIEAGAEVYFDKPAGFSDLESAVKALVERWLSIPTAEVR